MATAAEAVNLLMALSRCFCVDKRLRLAILIIILIIRSGLAAMGKLPQLAISPRSRGKLNPKIVVPESCAG
eukprot:638675-Hanusia_phi.AAC.1